MLSSLNELYTKYNWSFSTLNQYMIYEKEILDIFNNKNVDLYKDNVNLYFWIAKYYQYIEINYDKIKEYYLIAIDLNHVGAMFNLALYYQNIENDYDKMKKYYLMAINLNHTGAMNNLALYYKNIENNYDKMKEYYLMAINLNHTGAMNNLGYYYHITEINYDKMKKYYLMAIEQNNSDAMNNLGHYYHFTEINYDKMKKYYLMAIELNNSNAMNNLATYYKNINDKNNAINYYLMAIKLNHSNAVNTFKELTTPLQRYIYYTNNNIPFDETITNDIHIYNNKLKKSINDMCYICFEDDKTCVLLRCHGHYTCTDCYINIYDKPCPFCRL